MSIQQLEYIIAVDNYRHFGRAAEATFVTQPTLSMMIQKLEDELGVKVFDRTAHPVTPTIIGSRIIEQARITVKHFKEITEIVQDDKNLIQGDFNLGVIPTIAPYLIPDMLKNYKQRKESRFALNIHEMTTSKIIENILTGVLDGGILATPLKDPRISEHPVYYEKFYAYVSPFEELHKQRKITLEEFEKVRKIWLLEDVHCFRNQILRLCQLKKKKNHNLSANYEAGSIQTLINIVDANQGATIIPELAAMQLSEEQQDHLRDFKDVTAVREVSLVVGKEFIRKRLLQELIAIIKSSIPPSTQNPALKEFVIDI
jgi:LysR family hydrogen peroxide-inducible transcriptional activator